MNEDGENAMQMIGVNVWATHCRQTFIYRPWLIMAHIFDVTCYGGYNEWHMLLRTPEMPKLPRLSMFKEQINAKNVWMGA